MRAKLTKIAESPSRTFFDQIADPDVFCGGGSVAALTAAGAASTALLVMRLNVKRRSNAAIRDQIQRAIEETEAAIEAFYAASDDDIAILDELLVAHRSLRSGGDQAEYLTALAKAADSPIRMAERIADLLDAISAQLSISTRFTVSDLGAAAVLAEGACRAALLTAEVNIALLGEVDGANLDDVRRLHHRVGDVRQRVVAESTSIEETTRTMMLGEQTGNGHA